MNLDPGIERDIAQLFEDRIEAAYAVFGLGPAAADPSDQAASLDPSEPIESRLRKYEADLRYGLNLSARQVDEFVAEDPYVAELKGQGWATLIALRELYRHFPDVFG
jgi:hypothetical protein